VNPADPGELLALARDVAQQAAVFVAEQRTRPVEVADTKSSPIDIVTAVDTATEAMIRRLLLTARPGDGFLGEEGGVESGESGVTWIVDPIDGTVNYLYDLPQYAVSIAAHQGEQVVAGVVVNAATGQTYEATLGGGARCDGRDLAVSEVGPLSMRLIATGFGYSQDLRQVQASAIARLLPLVRDIRRLGSCALDLCLLAKGVFDGYFEEGVHDWDHAAAGLVVREAGGRTLLTTGRGGQDLLIAGPANGFDDLVDALVEAGALPAHAVATE
jgi:myo-inositol-1(or 4)-monophosphatase